MRLLLAELLLCCLSVSALADDGEADRPVLFNLAADGLCEHAPFARPLDEHSSRDMILDGYDKLIDRYATARITHLLLNVNYQRACYPSDVWDSYWDVDDPDTNVTGWQRKMWLIHRAGVDPYAACIDSSRKKGIVPWLSVRMNDTHYIDDPRKAGRFWKQHPEFRCSPRGGLNFAIAEVREHHLALIREVLERYDVDGVELDWMRFCHHFKPGEEAAGCDQLTEFMRRVNKLAAVWEKRRGHPIEVAARVPTVPEFARGLGIDAVVWVQERLVDTLILSSTWMPADRDTPVEKWRELIGGVGHDYRIAVSMGLWVKCDPSGAVMRNDLESARGFTANLLDRGADAIYVFNHFNMNDFEYSTRLTNGTSKRYSIFQELISESTRLTSFLNRPRRHILTYHDTAPPGMKNPKPLPAEVRRSMPTRLRIHTGPRPTSGRVVLRIGLATGPGMWDVHLEARMNGIDCPATDDLNKKGEYVPHTGKGFHVVWSVSQVAPRVVQFDVPLTAMRRGENRIELRVEEGKRQRVIWCEVLVAP